MDELQDGGAGEGQVDTGRQHHRRCDHQHGAVHGPYGQSQQEGAGADSAEDEGVCPCTGELKRGKRERWKRSRHPEQNCDEEVPALVSLTFLLDSQILLSENISFKIQCTQRNLDLGLSLKLVMNKLSPLKVIT